MSTAEDADGSPLHRPCPFITFYSFKGGVGRSMALINVAGILAARGFRVLVIDMDLEAPGISYLANEGGADRAGAQPGLVDLLLDATERGPEGDLFALPPDAAIRRYCAPYELPEGSRRRSDAALSIMPAGRLDPGYAGRLERLDLPGLYREGHGLGVMLSLKRVVQDSRLFDYVLVDSRTGFSDESGICTRDLADCVVVLSGLNKQNIEGTAAFFRALRAATQGEREVAVEVVLSPVPNGEDALVDERAAIAQRVFSEAWGARLACELQIPYHPQLALTEEPHVFRRRRGYLYEAYVALERRARELCGDTPEALIRAAVEHYEARRFDAALAYLQRVALLADDSSAIDAFVTAISGREGVACGPETDVLYAFLGARASPGALAAFAKGAGGDAWRLVWERRLDEAEVAFKLALRVAPASADVLGSYANFLWEQRKDLDEAEAMFKRAMEVAPRHPINLGNYANFLWEERKEPDAAEAMYKRALRVGPNRASMLGNYANFLWKERKDLDEAEAMYKRALAVEPDHANNLGNYANFLWKERRALDEAEAMYKRALAVEPDHAINLGNYANFLWKERKEPDAAEAMYKRALAVEPDHANHLGNYAIFLWEERKEPDAAEAMYKRVLAVDPDHANSLGNYACILLARGEVAEGVERVERALSRLDPARPGALDAECWMYLYCCGGAERRAEALSRLHRLVTVAGVKTGEWDFSGVIAVAERRGHPEAAQLRALAEVVAGRQGPATLEGWVAWRALGGGRSAG